MARCLSEMFHGLLSSKVWGISPALSWPDGISVYHFIKESSLRMVALVTLATWFVLRDSKKNYLAALLISRVNWSFCSPLTVPGVPCPSFTCT